MDNKNERDVFYIQVSSYYRQYLTSKYGPAPIAFPEEHPVSMVLLTKMVDNPLMKLVTPLSYSSVAFHYDRDGKVFDLDINIPSQDEKIDFLAVEMPEYVYNKHGKVRTGKTWQPTLIGTREVRELVKREFWMDCQEFVKDSLYLAHVNNRALTREKAISDFIATYGIPISEYDNIIRYDKRVRKRITEKIERKRAGECECGPSFFLCR